MTIILTLQLATFIIIAILGFFVLRKNPKSPANRYFWVFALGTAGWNLSIFSAITGLGNIVFWGKMAFAFGSFMPVGLFLFSAAFPWEDSKLREKTVALFVLGALFFILSISNWMIKSVEVVERLYLTGVFTKIYLLYLLYYFGFLIYAFVKLAKKYGESGREHKMQMKYVMAGMLVFFIPLFVTQLILPLIGIFKFNNLGPLFSLPMVGLISYAIIRHQLMDIRIVLQRGLIYTILFALLAVFYLATVNLLGFFLPKITNLTILLSAGLATIVGVFSLPALERYFQKITDKIFFKDRYEYSEAIHELSDILNKNIDLETTLKESAAGLKKTLKTDKAYFLLGSKLFFEEGGELRDLPLKYPKKFFKERLMHHKALIHSEIQDLIESAGSNPAQTSELKQIMKIGEELGIEVTAPVFLNEKLIGFLGLGEKLSGDDYSAKDLKLILTFSSHAATAIEKARLYKKVKNYSRRLEKKVKERTAEIAELNEEQKQMMVDISHGLQNPLTVIKGNLDALKKQTANPRIFVPLEKAIDESSAFIYQLLRLSRLETGREIFKKEKVDFSRLLDGFTEYFEVLARDKKIAVIREIEPGITVVGDKSKLEELMTNLVSNAVKYMPEDGEKKIYIILRAEKDAVRFSVKDTGVGINRKDLRNIFKRFYRVRAGDAARKEGAGLGLAISKKIAEKHGAKIIVKSEPGKGSEFTVTFPKTSRRA